MDRIPELVDGHEVRLLARDQRADLAHQPIERNRSLFIGGLAGELLGLLDEGSVIDRPHALAVFALVAFFARGFFAPMNCQWVGSPM